MHFLGWCALKRPGWLGLAAAEGFARNEPISKRKVVELEKGKRDLFECHRPSNYNK